MDIVSGNHIFVTLELFIALLTFCAVPCDLTRWFRNTFGPVKATMQRGDASVRAIVTTYVAVIGSASWLVLEIAPSGQQVLFILVNSLAITYLFLFSSSFRNEIFFPLFSRIFMD